MEDQERRAIIVAIWPKLHAGDWGRSHARDLDDHGGKPSFRSVCTATIPNAARAYSKISIPDPLGIIATLSDGTTRLLTPEAYERAYLALTPEQQKAHYASLMGKRAAPYQPNSDRLGRRYYGERLDGWATTWARHARAALAQIAEVTIPVEASSLRESATTTHVARL